MKWISALWLVFYFAGSLVCGAENQSCCNQKAGPGGHKSCHSQNSNQPAKNAFDLCCCKISADIPKTNIEIFTKKAFEFVTFHFSTGNIVSSSELFQFIQYLYTFLGPPGFTLHQHFSYAVFPALAPPLSL